MKKMLSSLVLAVVLFTAPSALANEHDTPPPLILGGTSAAAQTGNHSHTHENEKFPSIAAAVAMKVITMLVQGGVIR